MTRRKSGGEPVYRISFLNQGQLYEVYARTVSQSALFGFIEVEQLLFGERSKIIMDSSEEKLKNEFAGVRRIFVPLHAVVRIDEVEKEGAGRITSPDGAASGIKVIPLPVPPGGTSHR